MLVKFGKREHIESLLNEGHIHFSPINTFTQGSQPERSDKFEGAFKIINEEIIDIKCEHPQLGTFNFKPIKGRLAQMINYNNDNYCIFSAYAVTPKLFKDENSHIIDSRMSEFGNYAVLIHNPTEFVDRIKIELKESNIEIINCDLIEYIELSQQGTYDINFFNKTNVLSHQNEFRILIKTLNENPLDIKIGSITNIAILSTTEEIINSTFTAKYKK